MYWKTLDKASHSPEPAVPAEIAVLDRKGDPLVPLPPLAEVLVRGERGHVDGESVLVDHGGLHHEVGELGHIAAAEAEQRPLQHLLVTDAGQRALQSAHLHLNAQDQQALR